MSDKLKKTKQTINTVILSMGSSTKFSITFGDRRHSVLAMSEGNGRNFGLSILACQGAMKLGQELDYVSNSDLTSVYSAFQFSQVVLMSPYEFVASVIS